MSSQKDIFEDTFSEGPVCTLSRLLDDEKERISDTFLQEPVLCLSWLKCNNFTFKPSCYVMCGASNEFPEFGKIYRILRCGSEYYFLIKRYTTSHFDEQHHAYSILLKHDCLECCNFKTISFHEPFWAIAVDDKLFLSIKYDLSALYCHSN